MNYLYAACILLLYVSFAVADHKPDHEDPTFCSKNSTKCQQSTSINVTCVQQSDCIQYVNKNNGSLTLASANDLAKNEDKLRIVYGQKIPGLEKFVLYYGLAVVERNSTIKLTELKDKNSCHTGVDRTVGWKIPVGYLLYTKEMNFTENQYISASNFFGNSCAPGIKAKGVSQEVKDDFCKLCNDTCDSSDGYAGYVGAFKCMADGNNDRVGFVKQTTPDEVFRKYSGQYGASDDYKLLCKDGATAELKNFITCNIDKRPLHALVTRKDTSDEMVKKWQKMLEDATFDDLQKGGIVSSYAEKLEKYSGSVKDYVGDYGKHYNALSGQIPPVPTPTPTPTPTMKPSSAPSSFGSFALQAIAIFAFVFLI